MFTSYLKVKLLIRMPFQTLNLEKLAKLKGLIHLRHTFAAREYLIMVTKFKFSSVTKRRHLEKQT